MSSVATSTSTVVTTEPTSIAVTVPVRWLRVLRRTMRHVTRAAEVARAPRVDWIVRRCGTTLACMPQLRITEAASLLGVSDDTVRRWAEHGRLRLGKGPNGRAVVDGAELAELARELAEQPAVAGLGPRSARNSLRGIVTRVIRDTVVAQVDLQAGPYRVVSLMSREAADELGLEIGTIAYASIKATNVVIELDDRLRT